MRYGHEKTKIKQGEGLLCLFYKLYILHIRQSKNHRIQEIKKKKKRMAVDGGPRKETSLGDMHYC